MSSEHPPKTGDRQRPDSVTTDAGPPPRSAVASTFRGHDVDVLHDLPGKYFFMAWHNVMVVTWLDQATGQAVRQLERAAQAMDAQWPKGRSIVHIIPDGAKLPTEEGRQGLARLLKQNRKNIGCVATIFLSRGFRASAIRSISTAIKIESAEGVAMRQYASPQEIMDWFPEEHRRRTGYALPSEELLTLLNAVADYAARAEKTGAA